MFLPYHIYGREVIFVLYRAGYFSIILYSKNSSGE